MMKARRFILATGCAFAAASLLATTAAFAQNTALLIGNSDYENKCAEDLPSVVTDVVLMDAALSNAGYTVVSVANRIGIEMATDVEQNIPPALKAYVIYYSGHGEPAVDGALVGPDCTRLTPDNLWGALGDAMDGTLLILDSCGSGTFSEEINALDDRICVITASTGGDCASKGVFTPCFAAGLTGAADANADGSITVAEAATYAIANCGDGITTPTWDGGCPDRVIGMGPVSVEAASWGRVKAGYR